MQLSREGGSFRDPSGFVYYMEGELLRQINGVYKDEYDYFLASGLYDELAEAGLLVRHVEEPIDRRATEEGVAVLKPEVVPFINYPYEWCFSQLQDAALATLQIQKMALSRGMTLKDANAYNIQFIGARPKLIDTLSFERYEEGSPWVAYRQFCQHFLAPLVLVSMVDIRLGRMVRRFSDGIPLDLAAHMAPNRSKWKLGLALHLHAHARAQSNQAYMSPPAQSHTMGSNAMLGLIDNLEATVRGLSLPHKKTTWSNYYSETNYGDDAMQRKKSLVSELLDKVQPDPKIIWDLGANTGEFSKLAAERKIYTIAWDLDAMCVELHYQHLRKEHSKHIVPLVQDLSNPSPSVGWGLQERKSLTERGPADAILALALVHHLAIGNNAPLESIAELFARIGNWAIVEFVPKDDSQAQKLLKSRKDVFTDYHQDGFEFAFSRLFGTVARMPIEGTKRTLYLFKKREAQLD
jgi:hypothetical protein